ncbi:hypothetical protein MHI27_12005 [Paenibacillus sp. FSL H8-0261]|uniref:hyaluronate lyase N-terminal domain-containing protein n=1 Tax=Paenibacillus sp. FSL H8-0261 TaxID=2921381 RepID=UPI003253D2B0
MAVTTIKIRRGPASNLAGLNLQEGEPGFVVDTGKLLIGDGQGNNVVINPDQANAETATKLKTPRTIAITGDGTGTSGGFDGSANASITLVLANTGVAAGTFTKFTVDAKGRITSATTITAADIPNLTLSKITDAGTAASKNVGVAVGNVVGVESDGKINPNLLPALAITDTFPVASQAAMLALTAEVGDIAVRTDLNKTFILRVAGTSTLANWQEILTPTAAVSSVAGKTGAVTLTASDVGLGNVTNESKVTMFSSPALTGTPTGPTAAAGTNSTQLATTAFVEAVRAALATADALKAPLASPVLTGTPTAPTAPTATNNTQIATTAFVQSQGYLKASDTIDGGTF